MRSRALGLGGLIAALSSAGCSDRAAGKPATPSVPVGVAEVIQKAVPLQVTAFGNVQAYTSVAVKSQVAGQIVQVHFSEGQDVRKSALLFTIDPRPFEAALRQAEATLLQRRAEETQAGANLVRDIAQLENARVQEQRYRQLVEKELVAREQYDQFRTNLSALEATVNATRAAVENAKASTRWAQAAVDNARLQLAYTAIRAPLDGRTGNLLVQLGNVVKANEEPLVTLMQIHPIYVAFAVPEQHLAAIKRFQAERTLKVEARVPGPGPSAMGDLTFVNNTVDPATGTIQLKATFANGDNTLWPGQFVDVVLTLATQPDAIVVPSQAVQESQKGTYVFVVKPDLTVEARSVTVGRRLARETVIDRGVRPGERIVTDGQLRLVPGAKVEIKPPKAS